MAKWGEGDPRWIVEKREDGRNVNGWHWTESDWTTWAKERLTQILENLTIENSNVSITTSKVVVNGEVSVNTRKKKIILFYELDVSVNWEGQLKKDGSTGKGTIQMPYISDEQNGEDFEIRVTIENEANRDLKDEVRTAVIPVMKEKIGIMLTEFKNSTVEKTKLELKNSGVVSVDEVVENTKKQEQTPAAQTPVQTPQPKQPKTSSAPFKTAVIKMKEKFVCSPQDLYDCFVNPGRIKAYSGDESVINTQKGGKSILFGGAVETEMVELIPAKKIVQKWRFKEWPQNYFSTVTLQFEVKDNKTVLNVTQEGVPDSDRERTEGGWNSNYFTRIKGIFGYGAMVFN
jgi:activator of HSP90 ATPase